MDTLDSYLILKNALNSKESEHLVGKETLESVISYLKFGVHFNCITCKEIRHKLISKGVIDNGWNLI
jgi:hypothetical protein